MKEAGKRRKRLGVWLLAGLCAMFAAGCAAEDSAQNSAAYDDGDVYMSTTMAESGWVAETVEEEVSAEGSEQESADLLNDSARKLIYNADLTVETLEYDVFMRQIEEEVERLGGYIESLENNSGGYYYGNRMRYGSITARVPADSFEEFLTTVGSMGHVVNETRDVTDITLTYVDTQSRVEALEIEQERLLALLERADQIEDIIALEERLSSVRYQLESYASQLRTYDNLVDYSTVAMLVEEVIEVTEEAPVTLTERMSRGFANTLDEIEEGLQDAAVWVVTNVLYLIFWGIVIVIAVIAARKVLRRRRKRLAEKKEVPEKKDGDGEKE